MVRYGIVGAGTMGAEHIRNIALIPRAQVTAIADPHAPSITAAQAALGARAAEVAVFADAAALAQSGLCDAVVVATPNHTHRAVLEPLFDAGLHILCEKPLAHTPADAHAVAQRAATHPAVFWTGMEYRYMPPAARFIARVHAGAVGRPVMLAMREHRFPFLVKVGDWNRYAANTGGTMVEKCCHFFDLMRFILRAEAVSVFCSGGQDVNHLDERYGDHVPDILDNSFTIVDFDNGARAMLDLSMFADGAENQELFSATGDRARLDVAVPPGEITLSPRMGFHWPKAPVRETVAVDAAVLDAGHHHGATYYQHLAFLRAVSGEGPVEVSAEDGYRAVLIGAAAELSARERRVVSLAELAVR